MRHPGASYRRECCVDCGCHDPLGRVSRSATGTCPTCEPHFNHLDRIQALRKVSRRAGRQSSLHLDMLRGLLTRGRGRGRWSSRLRGRRRGALPPPQRSEFPVLRRCSRTVLYLAPEPQVTRDAWGFAHRSRRMPGPRSPQPARSSSVARTRTRTGPHPAPRTGTCLLWPPSGYGRMSITGSARGPRRCGSAVDRWSGRTRWFRTDHRPSTR